jgi:DNA-binding CsgD family transcriptional regulator
VVQLAAERLSNPEIAQRLFMSRRTVETHVSHALAKLDVTSRKDLTALARHHSGHGPA